MNVKFGELPQDAVVDSPLGMKGIDTAGSTVSGVRMDVNQAYAGIPRLLDVGQCNDAYSAIQIAVALAGAFNCGVNDLPLSMVLSWYEQKAVAILLTLLSLGIKGIRLGPSLPAFITPNVLNVLVENFDIKPITTPDEDLKAILG